VKKRWWVVFAVFLWQPCPANGENSWLMSFVAVELFYFRGRKPQHGQRAVYRRETTKCPAGIIYWFFLEINEKM